MTWVVLAVGFFCVVDKLDDILTELNAIKNRRDKP